MPQGSILEHANFAEFCAECRDEQAAADRFQCAIDGPVECIIRACYSLFAQHCANAYPLEYCIPQSHCRNKECTREWPNEHKQQLGLGAVRHRALWSDDVEREGKKAGEVEHAQHNVGPLYADEADNVAQARATFDILGGKDPWIRYSQLLREIAVEKRLYHGDVFQPRLFNDLAKMLGILGKRKLFEPMYKGLLLGSLGPEEKHED